MEANKLNNYYTTLEQTESETFIKIPIYNYSELGATMESLINVCTTVLEAQGYTGIQSFEYYDCIRVLEIMKSLIPHSEFELLDKLKKEIKPVKL